MVSPSRRSAWIRWLILLLVALGGRSVEGGSISAASSHSAVVKTTNGTVWTFGAGTNGRLGHGDQIQQVLPKSVASLSGVTAVASGASHTLFLKSDGTVWASGSNSGQVCDGTTTMRTSPVQVKTAASTYLTGVVAIAAGSDFSAALKSDGTVWTCGLNGSGQLGDNSTTQRLFAVQVKTGASTFLTGVAGISAGDLHVLAVKTDGSVVAWGSNGSGRLGIGATPATSPVAVPLTFPSGTVITTAAAGGSHSLARTSTGALYAWGNKANGRVGDGSSTGQQTTPLAITAISSVSDVAAGGSHSVAVDSSGVVFTWGLNSSGQLGQGTTNPMTLPTSVSGIADAISVVAASNHTMTVTSNGVVWVFGANTTGQLGDGTSEDRLSPVAISEPGYAWKVGTPTFSQASGTYTVTSSISTTISSATSGANIYYTLDGSEPTSSSTPYSGAITITQSLTLKARAYKSGIPTSNVGTRVYELVPYQPTFSVLTGTYSTPPSVVMSTTTTGATIRYTTDGSEPTASSTAYSGAVTVDVSKTLKAKAFKTAWTPSVTTSATYTLKVGLPTFNPAAGGYGSTQQVAVTTVSPNATLRYTTNSVQPVEIDPIVSGTIPVDRSMTLKVIGWKAGWTASDIAVATYMLNLGTVANPTFAPAGGTFTSSQTVSLACTTGGSEIRYTLDGSDPTSQSPIFAAPFTLSSTTTVKARAFKADMAPSAVASQTYTINLGTAETPTVSVASGRYVTQRTVTITAPTADEIHYTTTGADPTQTDTSISSGGTVVVDRSMILKVKTWKSGLPPSAVVRRDYVITGAVSAGGAHTLALKPNGTVWSWGYNGYSQLGRTGSTGVPGQPSGLSDAVAISAGGNHSLVLKSDGTVAGFGFNTSGQVGMGSVASPQATPVAVSGLSGVVAIAAGGSHSLALKSDGKVMSWGLRSSGQLGLGAGTYTGCDANKCWLPVEIPALTGVVAIAAGTNHSLALKSDGTLVAFGAGSAGQIGNGGFGATYTTPQTVLGPTGVSGIVASGNFSMALKADARGQGVLWLWGANGGGQLADGSKTTRSTPMSGPASVVAVAGGEEHVAVLTFDGLLWSWGNGTNAAIGDGGFGDRLWPVRVMSPPEALDLDAGTSFSVALASDGRIFGWGTNASSQASGDGGADTKLAPVAVPSFLLTDNAWLASDTDLDGLSNAAEYRMGTDPLNVDSNGDGLPDGLEAEMGRQPTSPDSDGDGLANGKEIEAGTDPHKADTDGDGVLDGNDAFPLDPTQSQATPNPSDTTPPAVTLQEPTNAVEL